MAAENLKKQAFVCYCRLGFGGSQAISDNLGLCSLNFCLWLPSPLKRVDLTLSILQTFFLFARGVSSTAGEAFSFSLGLDFLASSKKCTERFVFGLGVSSSFVFFLGCSSTSGVETFPLGLVLAGLLCFIPSLSFFFGLVSAGFGSSAIIIVPAALPTFKSISLSLSVGSLVLFFLMNHCYYAIVFLEDWQR